MKGTQCMSFFAGGAKSNCYPHEPSKDRDSETGKAPSRPSGWEACQLQPPNVTQRNQRWPKAPPVCLSPKPPTSSSLSSSKLPLKLPAPPQPSDASKHEQHRAMASITWSSPVAAAGCATSAATAHEPAPRRATTLVSRFHGVHLAAGAKAVRSEYSTSMPLKVTATAVVNTGVKQYTLPTWADFEMGRYPVYWDTENGRPPTAGQLLTIYFNPFASELTPNSEYGIGFNGGFNQPIMCGGEPRVMTRKERGSSCELIYGIKINVPLHAMTLEFSFTDGTNWDGPYKISMEIPPKLKGLPQRFFDEGLAKELAHEGACENAIYPEAVFVQDRCAFPAGMIQQGGDRCELDIVPGCTDPESPFFDPLANVDDGSCPYILD